MDKVTQGYHQLQRKKRLICKQESLTSHIQLIIGALLPAGILLSLIFIDNGQLSNVAKLLAIISVFLFVFIHNAMGIYRRSSDLTGGCKRLVTAWLIFLSAFLLIEGILHTHELSLHLLSQWTLFGLGSQCAAFALVYWGVKRLRDSEEENIPSVIIGNGRLGHHMERKINANRWIPDQVLGFVSCEGFKCDTTDVNSAPCLGDLENIQQVIAEYGIKRIYIAVPLEHSKKVEELHLSLLNLNVDLIWVPDIFALQLLNHSVREVAGIPLICLNESPVTSTRSSIFFKSLIDKVIAATALIVISPVMIATAIAVKLSSKGPVLFKQERHGWDGRIFNIYKFRSMTTHPEQDGEVTQATRFDARVTTVGRFIRRTSIDELPQLFNVLLGNMALVGPRPHAVAHNNYYGTKIKSYLARHRIKPGITGLAQISGCRGETETIDKMQSRVEYDVKYINNWSLWLDIKILLKTPLTLLSKNIY